MRSVFSIMVGVTVVLGGYASAPIARADAAKSKADVFDILSGETVGTSTLTRMPNAIRTAVKTTGIPAGHAATLWVVVFNNPEYCEDGCNGPDLLNPDVMGDLLYGGGTVVPANGITRLPGKIKVGDTSLSATDDFPFLDMPIGILDSLKAEIHLVVRSHGPVICGEVVDQISSFGGGCAIDLPPGVLPMMEGECSDIQAALHFPPHDDGGDDDDDDDDDDN